MASRRMERDREISGRGEKRFSGKRIRVQAEIELEAEKRRSRALSTPGMEHTGDKGPNTHWVHGENIEITVNM